MKIFINFLQGCYVRMVSADDVNIVGGSIHTVKKIGASVVASKEFGPPVNATKTKHVVMF